ncbi:hypothetical protein [Streptomyces sp. NPDC002265]|uniref:hypothetical protein n=1 Tax=Streptomyces sp. NPDC002265 TaxID=3154415 RepID=UPI003333880C
MSPSGIAFDHRLVQTAVIGHANSDHPVILPMEAFELDLWRKAHPTYTYWCGTQLGGCGGELSDKRYTDKVCHFAHHPNAPICHRTANGESSADHLFIKRGMQRLFQKKKLAGKVQTQNLGTGPGDAVDVYLPDARRRLRFQLSGLDYPAWRRAVGDLTEGSEDLDWIFGPDTPVTRELAGRHGFCLRVRCETVGGERRVHIGTETPDRTGTIKWTPLEDCELTPTGLTTPDVETIRISHPRPKPRSVPIQGSLVFAPVAGADSPSHSPFAAEDRRLVLADVKPVDSPIVRALLSLPADTDAPPAEHVYRVPDSARMLVLEDGHGWAIEANRYMRLNAHEAQQTGLWSPPPAGMPLAPEPPPARASLNTKQAEPEAPATPQSPSTITAAQAEPAAKPQPRTHDDLVTQLRDTLADLARLRTTTTWEALARTIGWELSKLSDIERRDLLVEVDSPLSKYVPVRSVLIHQDGGPLPYLGDILDRLGLPFAKRSPQLKRWAAVETERAFAAYGQPARAMGPRLDLTPHSLPQGQVTKALRAWKTPPVTAPPRKTSLLSTKRQDTRLSELIAELNELRPQLSKLVRKRSNKVILGAQVWLGEVPVGRVSKRVRAAGQSRQHHLKSLEDALESARADIAATAFLARQHNEEHTPTVPTPEASLPKQQVPASLPNQLGRAEVRIRRGLIDAASRRETIDLHDLPGARTLRDAALRRILTDMDCSPAPDVPLLSALATGPNGGPVPFFRQILKDIGLAVPQTDEALTAIWRREQERAYAKYAYHTSPLPPRLVPPA